MIDKEVNILLTNKEEVKFDCRICQNMFPPLLSQTLSESGTFRITNQMDHKKYKLYVTTSSRIVFESPGFLSYLTE